MATRMRTSTASTTAVAAPPPPPPLRINILEEYFQIENLRRLFGLHQVELSPAQDKPANSSEPDISSNRTEQHTALYNISNDINICPIIGIKSQTSLNFDLLTILLFLLILTF